MKRRPRKDPPARLVDAMRDDRVDRLLAFVEAQAPVPESEDDEPLIDPLKVFIYRMESITTAALGMLNGAEAALREAGLTDEADNIKKATDAYRQTARDAFALVKKHGLLT